MPYLLANICRKPSVGIENDRPDKWAKFGSTALQTAFGVFEVLERLVKESISL